LACYIPRWNTRQKTVTHPGTNRARRCVNFVHATNAANHYATPPTYNLGWDRQADRQGASITQGEVTSQSLSSRYDRHFVGITRHNELGQTTRIYRVIRIKLNQLVYENVHTITELTNNAHLSAIAVTNISRSFYLQDGGKNQLYLSSPKPSVRAARHLRLDVVHSAP